MNPSDASAICRQKQIVSHDFHALGKQAQDALAELYGQGFYQLGIED
jgi:hypothetical protein